MCLTSTSTSAVALKIVKDAGIFGLYRGWTATAMRDIGYGAYFFAYEATLRLFSSHGSDRTGEKSIPPWIPLLIAGGLAGIAGWVTTFPLDVIKTRIQGSERAFPPSPGRRNSLTALVSREPPPTADPFRNILSTVIYSYRTEGVSVFFRGLSPTLIRAIPVNMVTFATFESIVHTFS